MNIVFWLPAGFLPGIGGVETLSRVLAQGLIQAGHSVTIIAFQPDHDFISYVQIEGLAIFRFLSIQLANAHIQLQTVRQIKHLFVVQNFDVLHLHYAANSNLAYYFLLRAHFTLPQVMTVHGMLNQTEQALLKKISEQMDCIICVSKFLEQQIHSVLPEAQKQIVSVIYNAVEAPLCEQLPVEAPFTFLCLGRLTEEKGYDLAIAAFKQVHKKHLHARLLIVGEGPEFSKLVALAHEGFASANIKFKGSVAMDERFGILQECHVVIVPSRYESFGLVALEAGLAGRPVIASHTGGLMEIIHNGVTGLFFPTNNSDMLSACMEQLIQNQELATQMGKNALLTLGSRFNHTSMLTQYEQHYDTACSSRNLCLMIEK